MFLLNFKTLILEYIDIDIYSTQEFFISLAMSSRHQSIEGKEQQPNMEMYKTTHYTYLLFTRIDWGEIFFFIRIKFRHSVILLSFPKLKMLWSDIELCLKK